MSDQSTFVCTLCDTGYEEPDLRPGRECVYCPDDECRGDVVVRRLAELPRQPSVRELISATLLLQGALQAEAVNLRASGHDQQAHDLELDAARLAGIPSRVEAVRSELRRDAPTC